MENFQIISKKKKEILIISEIIKILFGSLRNDPNNFFTCYLNGDFENLRNGCSKIEKMLVFFSFFA